MLQHPALLAAAPDGLRENFAALRGWLGLAGARRALREAPAALTAGLLGEPAVMRVLVGRAGAAPEEAFAMLRRCPAVLSVPEPRLCQSLFFLQQLLAPQPEARAGGHPAGPAGAAAEVAVRSACGSGGPIGGAEAAGAEAAEAALAGPAVLALVLAEPQLLVSSTLAITAPAILKRLASLLGGAAAARAAVAAAPSLLLLPRERLAGALYALRGLGVRGRALRELVAAQPRLLCLDFSSPTFLQKLEWLAREAPGAPAQALLQHPGCLRTSLPALARRAAFLRAARPGAAGLASSDLPLLAATKRRFCKELGVPLEAFEEWERTKGAAPQGQLGPAAQPPQQQGVARP